MITVHEKDVVARGRILELLVCVCVCVCVYVSIYIYIYIYIKGLVAYNHNFHFRMKYIKKLPSKCMQQKC